MIADDPNDVVGKILKYVIAAAILYFAVRIAVSVWLGK